MARLAIILILLLGGTVQAQVFEDDFSDGDFSNNPAWSGADSNFVIFELDGNSVLRLNDNEAATSYLSTPSVGIEGFWEFFVRIDGTAPSGSNKAEVILISDQEDLSSNFNGYGVRIGETGDDLIRLVRFDGGDEGAVVLSDSTVFEAGGSYRIKVTRNASGNWSLEVGEGYNGELKDTGNTGVDNTYTTSAFLGVKVSYTSSRTDDFYFDFKIDSIQVEEPEFDEFEIGDVLINEFLKDPPPGSGLPEYIEVVNQTDKILNLKDWSVGDNSTLTIISDTNFVLHPDTFLVLTNNPDALKSTFGDLFALDVSLPALNNTSDQIRIYNASGVLVDSLAYNPDWGGEDVALERRSLNVSATLQANWGNSPNVNGGTPGKENDNEPDTTPPDLTDFEILNDSTFQLIFTEQIKPGPASNPDNYEIAVPVSASIQNTSGENDFVRASFFAPDTVILEFKQPVYSGSFANQLLIKNQEDVFGNVAEFIERFYELIVTDSPLPGDLVINEIMYDPPDGFSEFVEINLHVDKVFNLKGWTISDNSGEDVVITEEDFFIASSGISFQRGLAFNQHIILVPNNTINESANRKIVVGSRFPTLNNSTDAIVLKDPNGVVIDSLTYFSSWGGNEVSLERRSPELPSNLRENWGDSPSENLATPAQQNALGTDEDAPQIQEYETLSDQSIQLVFNESIQDTSATNIENFGLTNPLSASPILIRPEAVSFSSPDTIRLTFQEPFFELNLLEVFNQTDFFGNRNERIAIEFEYVITSSAEEGDVKITEFAYDAPEGFSEFVEIFNPTNKNFDLQGWTFNDNSGNRKSITNEQVFLKAGEYMVLAPDSSIFDLFGEIEILDVPGFPALNNTTDDLVLRDSNGLLMDSLTYSKNWGGEEVALERRTVEFSGIYQENWGDSPADEGGTPGRVNEILPDISPPIVIDAGFQSSSEIRLIFDERLFGESASNPENYYDPEGPNPYQVSVLADTVILFFENPFQDGESISIQLRNLTDLFGNVQNQQIINLTYVEVGVAELQNVVINEILFRRKDALSPEFVELFNPTNQNFELTGWTFSDAGTTIDLPNGIILSSGNYLVITDKEDFASELDNGLYLSNFPSLNDSGDEIVIRNADGITIDSLFYESSWGGNEPGISVERKDPLAASSDGANWSSSTSQSGYTAGTLSSVFEEDITPPHIIFSSVNDTSLFIAFSEVVRINSQTEITLENLEVTLTDVGNVVASNIRLSFENPGLKTKNSSQSGSVRIANLSDYKGNIAASVASLIAEPLQSGDVIINEILYNPLADSDDNLPDQTEYVEIYNPTEKAISLEGLFLHDAPDEDDEIRIIEPVSTQFKWLVPDSYMLIYSENEAEDFDQSRIARYFELEGTSAAELLKVDRSSLSLASSGDAIYLADSTGATIDSVFFDESWQNPNIFDTRGVALERIDPNGPSNDASIWSSSTHVSGGTPLRENSIFQEAGSAPDGNGISFTPNPFSPDDDGFEDNLFINYNLDAPDYLLRVRIFDRYGREVRELVNNYQAGFEGSLIWDGLTDDRTRNRVGIYIVLFEAFDSTSGRDRTFKETVVLARKF